jgi:eukaryotic-like serine/threonine-protein kinase
MSASQTAPPADRDERLAQLLDQLNEQARRGQEPQLEAAIADNPDLSEELRSLWAAARVADEFTRPPGNSAAAGSSADIRAAGLAEQLTVSGHDQAPPSRDFGDYELLEELGRGGMGVVWKAWQKSLRRTVALKMILRGVHATAADLARFQVEATAAGNLHHPNIVSVFDAGVHDGLAFFTMRYVEGQTLARTMAGSPLRPRDAARYLARVSRAVQHAHERGILHRDLKPSNVLIDRDGQALVTDFGLAKRVPATDGTPAEKTSLTQSGALIGTPSYMAPEQVSGNRGVPGPASDIYSLGVILYEMLTGRPPFQGATPVDTLLLVLEQDPVRPRLLNPKVDPDLELICLKCLQKEPGLRYSSAAELAADLEAFLNGEQLSVRSLGVRALITFFTRAFRETHHAPVLENWGVLWMWHSLAISLLCVLTSWLKWQGYQAPLWYLLLWGGGLIVWGSIFWGLRKRGGPVLFVERQVAHVWGAAVAATIVLFVAEWILELPVLTLSPILAVIAGMTFVVKAGMLSGEFYWAAAAEFATAVPMAWLGRIGYEYLEPLLFGAVAALCFFIPGLKYHRQRLRSQRAETAFPREATS